MLDYNQSIESLAVENCARKTAAYCAEKTDHFGATVSDFDDGGGDDDGDDEDDWSRFESPVHEHRMSWNPRVL